MRHFCRFWGTSEQTTRGSKMRMLPSSESSANSQDEPKEEHLHGDEIKVFCSSQAQVRGHKPGREPAGSNTCTAHSTLTGTVLRFHVAFGPLCFGTSTVSEAKLLLLWTDGTILFTSTFILSFYCIFKLG